MYECHLFQSKVTGEQLGLAFVVFVVIAGLVWAVVWAMWKGPDDH